MCLALGVGQLFATRMPWVALSVASIEDPTKGTSKQTFGLTMTPALTRRARVDVVETARRTNRFALECASLPCGSWVGAHLPRFADWLARGAWDGAYCPRVSEVVVFAAANSA